MKAATARPERTMRGVAHDINMRALEHGSVATMLRAIFIEVSDSLQAGSDRQPEWTKDLWEGLAVIERFLERDSTEITQLVDELHLHLDEAERKDGAR